MKTLVARKPLPRHCTPQSDSNMCGFLTICTGVFTAGVRDDEGHSPLNIAIMKQYGGPGCVDVALYLMNHGCTCSDEDKAKLLCKACSNGKLDVVKELVEQHKVDPNSEC